MEAENEMIEDVINYEAVPVTGPAPTFKWRMSMTIGKIASALATAQGKFDPILKENDNPAYRGSKYADLSSIIAGTQKHLADVGIAVIQMPHAEFGSDDTKMLTLTTMLAHSSGEWIMCDLEMPAMMRERFDAQSVGSGITYARRYALQSMLGVAAEVDDDGNKASGVGTREQAQAVGAQKAADKQAETPAPTLEIVPWKLDTLILRGLAVGVLRSMMTPAQHTQVNMKWDKEARAWEVRAADGNLVASIAEKFKIPVKWIESNA
jgi:hypothetical protein